MALRRLLLVTLIASTACSCASEPSAREARSRWLRDVNIQDNRDLLERANEGTAGKFRKMRSTPYNYFRGTAGVFWRDVLQPHASRHPTAFGSDASHLALLVGDPHPENIGTYLGGDGRIHIDFNDFDASTYGPYHLDVRRLALGFYVLATSSPDLAPDALTIAREVALGYAETLMELDAGRAYALSFERGRGAAEAGVVLGDLVRRAERDGDLREELDEYAPVVDGARAMFYGTLEAPEVMGVLRDQLDEPTDAEVALVEELIANYARSIIASNTDADADAVAIKGISRRLGAGVSSYPIRRYYVLTEGPTDALDDDLLLEVKETLDPPPLQRLVVLSVRKQLSNGERVVEAQRALQTREDNDPWLGWARIGALSARVRHRTKYQKGVDAGRIAEEVAAGEYGVDAVVELARQAGSLLAATHTRAPLASGASSLDAIAAALGPDPSAFADETRDFVADYGPRTLEDYALFQELLDTHGDTLGYRPVRPMEQ